MAHSYDPNIPCALCGNRLEGEVMAVHPECMQSQHYEPIATKDATIAERDATIVTQTAVIAAGDAMAVTDDALTDQIDLLGEDLAYSDVEALTTAAKGAKTTYMALR